MKELRGRRTQETPRGAGKGAGRGSRAVAPGCVCLTVSTGWDPKLNLCTGEPGSLRQKQKARECTWIYFSYYLGECETATARRCWTDKLRGGGGRRRTDTMERSLGQTGGAGDKQTAAGPRETGNLRPWFSPIPSPQLPPHTGLPDGSSVRPGRSWLHPVPLPHRQARDRNSLHVAKRRRSTARRVTASLAPGGGGERGTAAESFVAGRAWRPQPPRHSPFPPSPTHFILLKRQEHFTGSGWTARRD